MAEFKDKTNTEVRGKDHRGKPIMADTQYYAVSDKDYLNQLKNSFANELMLLEMATLVRGQRAVTHNAGEDRSSSLHGFSVALTQRTNYLTAELAKLTALLAKI
jgi:hypothetical protein